MKWLIGTALFLIAALGSEVIPDESHFSDQIIACVKADGRGNLVFNQLGLTSGHECRRMHLLMKYRDGRYQ